jgi:hypothetical protein
MARAKTPPSPTFFTPTAQIAQSTHQEKLQASPSYAYTPTPASAILSPIAEAALWRYRASKALRLWQQSLENLDLLTPTIAINLSQTFQKLSKSRYTVALIAEVSRGKSELINALLFSQYGRRIVPTGAGRTTMCPVEFFCDPSTPPYLDLLPISSLAPLPDDTGLEPPSSLSELCNIPSAWQRYDLDETNADTLALAMQRISESQTIPTAEAERLGIHIASTDARNIEDTTSSIEVPFWRYARMNLHHPLLETGLSLLDTPGLNALGHESELTLEILPNTDAVLFLLSADTGVSHSEQLIWERFLQHLPKNNTRLILNKTDTLNDPLRNPYESQDALKDQIERCAKAMKMPKDAVFALSAQQGLVARIAKNPLDFERSGLGPLEADLQSNLLEKCQLRMKHMVLQTLIVNYHALSESLSTEALELHTELGQLTALSNSKDRLYAIHAYTSDTQKRQALEATLINKLHARLNNHRQTLMDMLSISDIQHSFSTALDRCQTGQIHTIHQELTIALAAAQMRFVAIQNEMEATQTSVVDSLCKLERLMPEVQGKPNNSKEVMTEGITNSLPVMPNLTSVLVEIKRLAQRYKPGASSLFPNLKMLHLTATQRKKHAATTTLAMERCMQLGNSLHIETMPWLEALRQYVEQAQHRHQADIQKRSNALSRMDEAQNDLNLSCQQLTDTLRTTLERKRYLDHAYAEAQSLLKATPKA